MFPIIKQREAVTENDISSMLGRAGIGKERSRKFEPTDDENSENYADGKGSLLHLYNGKKHYEPDGFTKGTKVIKNEKN